MAQHYPPLIYVVDDDEDDRYLLQTIFYKYYSTCQLRSFENGSGLITQLTHRLDNRLPNLIILDLEMPVFNGFELLRYLKQDSVYRSIPVAVVSGSQHSEQINRCYELGTATYVSKSSKYTQLVANIGYLQQYWLRAPEEYPVAKPAREAERQSVSLNLTTLSLN